MSRSFELKTAKREDITLSFGIFGASGSGKTYSALSLATGIVSVTGGDIVVIDTENGRAAHYADKFNFQVFDFQPPFNSETYLDALKAFDKKGRVIIVDSMSHEHSGEGGVLDRHAEFMNERDNKPQYAQIGWAQVKKGRKALIAQLPRMKSHLILCFRAKQGIRQERNDKGKIEPVNVGWVEEGADAILYEMTGSALLTPSSNGVPNWSPEGKASRELIKKPLSFRGIIDTSEAFSEEMGRKLALSAKGKAEPVKPTDMSPKAFIEAASKRASQAINHAQLLEFRKSSLEYGKNAGYNEDVMMEATDFFLARENFYNSKGGA
jgi:ABC-type oligopeptide transport system ATPase subunit